MLEACNFFLACLNANAPRVAVENPIMFYEAQERIGVEPSQLVCPSMFGDTKTKSTYLWLKGLPKLVGSRSKLKLPVGARDYVSALRASKAKQGLLRSITSTFLATAMAEQWSS